MYVKENNTPPPPVPIDAPVDFTVSPNPYTAFDFGLVVDISRTDAVSSGKQRKSIIILWK